MQNVLSIHGTINGVKSSTNIRIGGLPMKYCFIFVFLVIFISANSCIGDEYSDYTFAYNLFEEQVYKIAREQFEKFIENYPVSDKADDARLFIGYCSFYLGEYSKAIENYRRLLNDYPASELRVDALRGIAEAWSN